jgi:hypothetical protein
MKNNFLNRLNRISAKRIAASLIMLAMAFAFLASPAPTNAAIYLTQELQVGSTGAQVTALQEFLAADSSIYPQGLVTGYFGSLTRAAVMRFQARYGISQVGRVGPQTKAKINALGSLVGGGGSTSNGLTTGPIMSSIAVVTTTNTTVYWTTNELTRAKLFYNTVPLAAAEASADFQEPAISGSVLVDPAFALNHVFVLNTSSMATTTVGGVATTTPSSIPAGTLFYFIAMSIDQNNNVTVSPMGSFRSM